MKTIYAVNVLFKDSSSEGERQVILNVVIDALINLPDCIESITLVKGHSQEIEMEIINEKADG